MNHDDSTREDLFADHDEAVAFAQAYYATEFPNDGRRGCPPLERLRAAARSGHLPDEQLRIHLFNCSECFRSYRGARMGGSRQAPAARYRWRSLVAAAAGLNLRPLPIAASFCLLLIGIGITAMLWGARNDVPSVAANYSNREGLPDAVRQRAGEGGGAADAPDLPSPETGAAGVRQNSQAPRRKAEKRSRRAQAALPIIEISLIEDDLLRGDDRHRQRVINLAPDRQRLRLRMPRGSARGRYMVRILDAFGKSVVSTAANSDGKTLTVDLDLRGLDAKKYRLCLARNGEAPDCYLMNVDEQRSRPLK